MITKEQKQKLINLNDSRVNEVLGVIEYKEGKWYKNPESKFMVLIKEIIDDNNCYGYYFCGSEGIYKGLNDVGLSKCIEATNKEVEQKLIEEAKRRGFNEGVKFKSLSENGKIRTISDKIRIDYYISTNILTISTSEEEWDNKRDVQSNPTIFKDGVWAEIIDDKAELKQEIKELRNKLKSLEENL